MNSARDREETSNGRRERFSVGAFAQHYRLPPVSTLLCSRLREHIGWFLAMRWPMSSTLKREAFDWLPRSEVIRTNLNNVRQQTRDTGHGMLYLSDKSSAARSRTSVPVANLAATMMRSIAERVIRGEDEGYKTEDDS